MKKEYPVIDMYKTGQNIKRIMSRRGLTVREVQKYLGLHTPQGIYHWFDGKSLPTVDNLYALSELFRMPVDEILCGNRKEKFQGFRSVTMKRLIEYLEVGRGLRDGQKSA